MKNKIATDLEQSKKLAEILPIESADMWIAERYKGQVMENGHYIVEEKPSYYMSLIKPSNTNYSQDIVNDIPCWSLASLLAQLDETVTTDDDDFNLHIFVENGGYYVQYDDNYEGKILVESGFQEYLMDAVYEVVLKLSELKLL